VIQICQILSKENLVFICMDVTLLLLLFDVYKLSKALYGLKQAPREWYECLRDFLISNAFKVEKANPILFTKTCNGDLFVCQIYVDDIIFGSTNQKSCEEFSRVMMQKFVMSMMGELTYFLGF
jgi:hypothetical protein